MVEMTAHDRRTTLLAIRLYFFTAPWLKSLVEYSYMLPKYSVKILREKNGRFVFISLFVKVAFYM